MSDELKAYTQRVTQKLVDAGKIIEAGWITYKLHCIPVDAPEMQLDGSRQAFFAGAQHLWASIMNMMTDEAGSTPADERRMQNIGKELYAFYLELCKRHGIPPR